MRECFFTPWEPNPAAWDEVTPGREFLVIRVTCPCGRPEAYTMAIADHCEPWMVHQRVTRACLEHLASDQEKGVEFEPAILELLRWKNTAKHWT